MLITPVYSLPAVGTDPGASKRVALSTEKLRLSVATRTTRGVANYTLIRRGEGGIWVKTPHAIHLDGAGETAELVVEDISADVGLVQGELWAVLGDSGRETSDDLVYLSPVGALVDSSAFYK